MGSEWACNRIVRTISWKSFAFAFLQLLFSQSAWQDSGKQQTSLTLIKRCGVVATVLGVTRRLWPWRGGDREGSIDVGRATFSGVGYG